MNEIVEIGGSQFVIDIREIDVLGRREAGRKCTCCDLEDEKRHKLNAMLLSGESYRDIAKHFGLHHAAIHRHNHRHLAPALYQFLGDNSMLLDARLMDADRVITDLGRIRTKMADIALDDRQETRDQVAASRSVSGISRTALELHGKLGTPGSVNVNVGAGVGSDGGNEELEALRAVLLERGMHDVIEAAGAKLAGVELIEAEVVADGDD